MTREPFSRRYHRRAHPEELLYDDVPESARAELLRLLGDLIGPARSKYPGISAENLYRCRCFATRRFPLALDTSPKPWGNQTIYDTDWQEEQNFAWQEVEATIRSCEWFEFYDLCEDINGLFDMDEDRARRQAYIRNLNALLKEEGLGYQMTDRGAIERIIGSAFVDEQLAETQQLLANPKFRGPDEQFGKAIRFLSQRPEPDTENCVKDAVGAMEATARILANDEKAIFPDIIDREPFKSGIHGAVREAMKRVYGYRGDVGGVAHGLVGQSKVGVEEAEFVLGFCASAIVYLVNKFETQAQ